MGHGHGYRARTLERRWPESSPMSTDASSNSIGASSPTSTGASSPTSTDATEQAIVVASLPAGKDISALQWCMCVCVCACVRVGCCASRCGELRVMAEGIADQQVRCMRIHPQAPWWRCWATPRPERINLVTAQVGGQTDARWCRHRCQSHHRHQITRPTSFA